jgi:hypothetical protein
VDAGITLAFIDGNHENHTLLRLKCGGEPVAPGFWQIRPNLHYIARATAWTVASVRFLGLGGAYSIDKAWRVEHEARRNEPRSLWWPEEEITEAETAAAMQAGRIDIMLAHDKPTASHLPYRLRDIPECLPNQEKIDRVMAATRPSLLLHGHFHSPYRDRIRLGRRTCEVIGLAANPKAARLHSPYRFTDSWVILNLERGRYQLEGLSARLA